MIKYILLLYFLACIVSSKYQCKNLAGKAVDWFVIYKLPRFDSKTTTGKEYVYCDNDNTTWSKLSDVSHPTGPLGRTLKQSNDNHNKDRPSNNFYLYYSDDDPINPSESYRGHAKGVALFDSNTGFWLTHSVPNFPTIKNFTFPSTAQKFAQILFCISLTTDNLGALAEHWRYLQVTPYSSNLPSTFSIRFPALRNVIARQSLPRSATNYLHKAAVTTVNGFPFMIYSKHRKYNGDIWNDVISRQNQVVLGVQSWLNGGADDLHSTCTKDSQVNDVTDIDILGHQFKSSKDHSKWAVGVNIQNPIVCFGDLNRQKSQLQRGGGAICAQNRQLWQLFRSMIKNVEVCKSSALAGIGVANAFATAFIMTR